MSALRVAAVELVKLRSHRGFVFFSLALLVGWKLLALVEIRAGDDGGGLDDISLNGFYLTARSAGFGLMLWGVLLAVLVAQSIAGEAERGQLRMLLVRPVTRAGHYLGRTGAWFVATTVAVLADAILSVAIGAPTLGFGDVADVGLQGEAYGAAALRVDLLVAYLRTDLALFSIAAVALAVSALARQATTAITATLLVLAASGGVGFVLGAPIDRWLFTTWSLRSFAVLERITAGTTVYPEPGEALLAIGVPLGTAVLATVVGLAAFTRRDVQS